MYLQDRELNAVLEEYFNEDNQVVVTDLMIPISEGMYWDPITEAARYTFLPRIKRDESLKAIWKECEQAQNLLNTKGEDIEKADLYKMGDLALKIYTIGCEVSTIIMIPIVPIYLLQRLFVYALRFGEYKLGESYADKCISQLKIAKAKHKNDTKYCKNIDDQIAKIEKIKDEAKKDNGKK